MAVSLSQVSTALARKLLDWSEFGQLCELGRQVHYCGLSGELHPPLPLQGAEDAVIQGVVVPAFPSPYSALQWITW